MNALPFLLELKRFDINIKLVDGKLKVDAPEGTLTPGLIRELKRQKEEIIHFLHLSTQDKTHYQSIEPAEEKDYYPLSSAQKRLFFLQQMEPRSSVYNIPSIIPLPGEIDVKKLEATFRKLIQRHESLRTSFHMVNNVPVQRVHRDVDFQVLNYDSLEFVRAFDLSQAPLMRAGLHKTADQRSLLLVDIHHIITDGISQEILKRDFMMLYRGESLSPLHIQYKDFAVLQNSDTERSERKNKERYWLEEFSGEIPVLNIPSDFPRPAVQSFEGNNTGFEIPEADTAALAALARSEGVTQYMMLLALFNILFSKLSRQDDIVIGTSVAGRRHADLDKVIGMFVNTLALRNYPGGELSVRQFLSHVKARTLASFENQEYPFEDLVEKVVKGRDTGRNPLFDVMLVLQNLNRMTGGFENKNPDVGGDSHMPTSDTFGDLQQSSRFDLSITVLEDQGKLKFILEYCTKLFTEQTIQRYMDYFHRILQQVVKQPAKKIGDLEIISPEEKQRILYEFNDTSSPYPEDKTIHQLFSQQARKTPDAIALMGPYLGHRELDSPVSGRGDSSPAIQCTYQYVDEASDRLASMLRQKGVLNDELVGIMMMPSVERIIGILGILKAGGAYMAIAADTPQKRTASLLNDCHAKILLTDADALKPHSFTALQVVQTDRPTAARTAIRPQIRDLDALPIIDRSLVDYDKYNQYLGEALVTHSISIQATRGCPYNCLYCHKIWPKGHVIRSAEKIFAELLTYYNMGVRRFALIDDIFNLNVKNSSRFFQLIIDNGLKVNLFFPNGLRGDILTPDYIDLMVRAGTTGISLALETASPRLQKLLQKNLNIEKLRRNLEYITQTHPQIILELYLMHGFPTETEEEAVKTMDFLKSIKWVHFPLFNILKVFPNTEIADLALENGVSPEAIADSENLAFHELPSTLPFDQNFTRMMQADYLNNYFLNKERLLSVLPYQMKVLTEDEIIKKYNSYLDLKVATFAELLPAIGISPDELEDMNCLDEKTVTVSGLTPKMRQHFPNPPKSPDALNILLLDLSQSFTHEAHQLNDLVEPPLGLMSLLTYVNHVYGERVNGKIAKAFIDFDSFAELHQLIRQFKPDLIGIRSLTFYKDFCHRATSYIRSWGITAPIIMGGPYATTNYSSILQDPNVDLVVIGEGEITFAELVGKILDNHKKLPARDQLEQIPGLAYPLQQPGKEQKPGRDIIFMDNLPRLLENRPIELPEKTGGPNNLAYGIFTSGSTGKPKGVIVEHKNVVRLVQNTNFVEFQPGHRIMQTGALEFDASTFEIWGALLNGLPLALLSKDKLLSPTVLKETIKKNKISTIWMTSPLFNQMCDADIEIFEPLTYLLVGGDVLSPAHIDKVKRRYPWINIVNGYGPTENTTFSTTHLIAKKYSGAIPIGRPIANSTCYVVDGYGHLQPVGIPGELLVGGDGVARGYLNHPEYTATRFKPDPFAALHSPSTTHPTLYHTGDLAAWQPDGTIAFLGRMDNQLKIRGFRVEPGEINTYLMNHKDVRESVVLALQNDAGKFLCAYIIPNRGDIDDQASFSSELSAFLAKSLPPHMIPSYFVLIDKMPLTPNGKIDRRALPHPHDNKSSSKAGETSAHEEGYVAPSTPVEKILAEIWGKVLGRDHIGVNENFFMAGGDSIKSIQVISRMNNAGYKLEVKDLFQYPVISELAPHVKKSRRVPSQETVTGPVPLTPVQHLFFQQDLKDAHHFNQSAMFHAEKLPDAQTIRKVFQKIQSHHDALRMTYQENPETNEIVQTSHDSDFPVSLEEPDLRQSKDQLERLDKEANRLQAGIDLKNGPLMKLGLIHMDDGDRLLVVFHHLVIDGVSWRIILEDMQTLFSQSKAGQKLHLPQKTDSYKLWAESLIRYSGSKASLNERAYWKHVENHAPAPIPRDFPHTANIVRDTRTISFSLDEEKTRLLLTKVNRAFGTEINDILLTALVMSAKEVFRRDRLLIALEGHGREEIMEDIDITRTVGWFTCVYPVLLDTAGTTDPARSIKEVKETLRRIPHKGIGYGILKYLTPGQYKEDMHFKLQPRISFNYLGQFDSDVAQGSFFKIAKESVGYSQSPENQRDYDIDITGMTASKRLTMNLCYNENLFKDQTMSALFDVFRDRLEQLIQFCASRDFSLRTPGDFTYKDLDIDTIDRLQHEYPDIDDLYALTPMQEGMLFHAQLDPTSNSYFSQVSYRCRGDVNIKLVEQSLNLLLHRHDILRTAFVYRDVKRPVQVVLKERQIDFYYQDIRRLPSREEKDAFVKEFNRKDMECSFDLSRDVLMRVSILHIDHDEYEFVWSFHHILMDGWCLGIVNSEFFHIYNALSAKRAPGLPEVKPYRTYLQWLEKQDPEESSRYWERYLHGFEEQTGVPGKKATADTAQAYDNREVSTILDRETTAALNRVAARNQVTLNTVAQVVWGIVLGAYTRKRDVVFGAVVSGRPHQLEGVESMVGLFINAIPVRIRFDKPITINRLLQNVQADSVAAEPYHYSPLADIQAASPLKQNLIDHLLVFENYPVSDQIQGAGKDGGDSGGLQLELADVNVFEQTNYDFNLSVEGVDLLTVKFQFNANVYDPEYVERISRHYIHAVRQVIENDETDVSKIDLLDREEKDLVLYQFNQTAAEPVTRTVLQDFHTQVGKTPDNTAVIDASGNSLTYRQLDDAAARLAASLNSRGVTPQANPIVAIKMPPGIQMIIAILGILKAGGVYLPIDTSYPPERIQYMLRDSNALLCLESLEDIDKTGGEPALLPQDTGKAALDRTAYVIYTSGTTGKPKGAAVTHRNLASYVDAFDRRFHLNETDIVLQQASYSFDAFVEEMYPILLKGGAIAIPSREEVTDMARLTTFIKRRQVTMITCSPLMLNYFNQNLRQSSVRIFISGGDRLKAEYIDNLLKTADVYNTYGPTEGTVCATYYQCTGRENGAVPIGKPIHRYQVYVLDQDLKPLPVGVNGELCIAGAGVTRGYINRPELTAERFSSFNRSYKTYKSNMTHSKEDRFYRTGDLVHWLPDGNIQFVGRIDMQVKIRGFRIELGEIESKLLTHPDIKEALVLAAGEPGAVGETELAAYFSASSEIEPGKLRTYLSRTLPMYMIPSYFVQIDALPLTSSGKIDTRALPRPGQLTGGIYTAPRNETEDLLVEIWSDVLGHPANGRAIGIDDDFFHLGGHSLKAVIIASRIHKELEVQVPLALLFKYPTIRELAQHIGASAKEHYESIPAVEKQEYYPCSSAQKRLYFLQQIEPGSAVNNMPAVIPMPADADIDKLESAFIQLIQRHESLRTSFHMIDDVLMQRVHEEVPFKLGRYDSLDFVRPFDLSQAPLVRAGILATPGGPRLLLMDMHHIISDGTSQEILQQDFIALYRGESLPPLRIQYKDFSAWQNSDREKQEQKRREQYWLDVFSENIPLLNLPADYPRPAVQSFAGENIPFRLSAQETDALKTMAEKNGVSLFMLLLAVYNILLAKLSGQDDIVVGTPTAGRRHADLERVAGMFVNTLALRSKPAGEKALPAFLEEIKENTLKAFDNQDIQFEDLVEKVKVKRDMGRNPLFDVMLVLQNLVGPDSSEKIKETFQSLPTTGNPEDYMGIYNTSKFDMTFTAVEENGELGFSVQYCTKLFKRETIERFITYFKNIVSIVLEQPGIVIGDICILSDEERDRVLNQFNRTDAPYPADRTIQELFALQAARTPDAVALSCASSPSGILDRHITYRQLAIESDRTAAALREKGVGPGTIAAVKMERSFDLVIAILGILKTGAAYLPIDPEYPPERIRYMLSDSNAVLCIHTLEELDLPYPPVPAAGQHGDYAYVIYTSGSSGKPKGVLIRHQGIANLVQFHGDTFKDEDYTRAGQVSGPGFDAMAFEMWPALLRGAALCIVPSDIRADAGKMRDWLLTNRITAAFQSTAIAEQLLDLQWPTESVPLKIIWTAGDRLNRFLDRPYPFKFYNLYGPTEDTIWTTMLEVPVNPGAGTAPSIGKPIANHRVYILDGNMLPQPVGTAGELCISSVGTAAGYLNKPQLTAEKFNQDFQDYHDDQDKKIEADNRLYRTGDLARWLPDGNIEFIGRIDQQVKIRGFRIEPGEIQARLLTHPAVHEAVVTVRDDQTNRERCLVAYIVTGGEIEISQLREYLALELPSYMLPSYFVPVEKFPLTANGKIDVKALPEPQARSSGSYTAPRSEIETQLATIWHEVLGIPADQKPIGIDDDFFQLGGHSLKATLIAAKMHRRMNIPVPLTEIFQRPTIRELAQYAAQTGTQSFQTISAVEKKEYYPLSSAQKRLYFLQNLKPRSTVYNIPTLLPLHEDVEIPRLEDAFKQLIKRHESLRTSFHMINDELVQRVHEDVPFQVQTFDRPDAVSPFDLSQAPLLRAGLVTGDQGRRLLLVDMHHIITDGSSQVILTREFLELYADPEAQLPSLPLQYKDFALWQSAGAQAQTRARQERYWLNQFEDPVPVLDLPLDYPRTVPRNLAGGIHHFQLPHDLTAALQNIAAQQGATLFMVLLACLNVLLAKLSGQEDIVVGTPTAGRRHADLENIIGMFVNTLALRNTPVGEKSFNRFLAEVKEHTLAAFENQEYQFEDLVEKAGVERDMSRSPLFDIMLVLQNQSQPAADQTRTPELEKVYRDILNETKFDLTLRANETARGLQFTFEYAAGLFKEETIQRFSRYLINIFSALSQNNPPRLADIDILPEDEKQQLLYTFNDTRADYPETETIHSLFTRRAQKTPDHIAVSGPSGRLTYRELDRRSLRLARELAGKGLAGGSVAAVLSDPTPLMLVAIFAVLKTGACYLPIDPTTPHERIQYMLADSGCPVLVTPAHLKETLPFAGETVVIPENEEDFDSSASMEKEGEFPHSQDPANPVYMIYTSGTTGKPKGVVLRHRNLVNYVNWFSNFARLTYVDRTILTSSFAFDLGYTSLFPSLLNGAQLHILPKETYMQPGALLNYIHDRRITYLKMTPSLFSVILRDFEFSEEKFESMRLLVLGGEAIIPADVENAYRQCPNLQIMNHYGPTEATIGCVAQYIQRRDLEEYKAVPTIGRPIANMNAYILDRHLNILPAGAAGELCFSGAGIAVGYHKQAQMTGEKFPSLTKLGNLPASYRLPDGHDRVYRTGDLARRLPSGLIAFMGRMDFQIKIRGYRVEIKEIESKLQDHQDIKEAVILPMKNQSGTTALCAYIVPVPGCAVPEAGHLSRYLSAWLPDYMIPSYFVALESLPLTANGKLDRKALPKPEITNLSHYVEPKGPIQQTLARMWSEMLDLELDKIGASDSFFDLGGNSLNAVVFISKVHKEFNARIPMEKLFEAPTIISLAQRINDAAGEQYAAVRPVEKRDYYPLSSAQKRLYILHMMEENNTAYNMPRLIQLPEAPDLERLEQVFHALIRRHESFRTSFHMLDETPVQRVFDHVDFTIHQHRHRHNSDTESTPFEEDVFARFVRPFDLSRAPLLRVTLVNAGDRHFLLIDMHHIISDGLSRLMLERDFAALYRGEEPAPLRIQYKDFAQWQNSPEQIQHLRKQEEYWLRQFAGDIPVLDLPLDYPRPTVQSFDGDGIRFEFSVEQSAALNALAKTHGATLYMVLLAAFNVWLSRLANQEDIIVGTPFAGRRHADLEHVMGLFVNTLAMRNFPQGEKTFAAFFQEVKDRTLKAIENQDYPFEDLVEKVAVNRDAGRNPLFDVMFALQNIARGSDANQKPQDDFFPDQPHAPKTAKFDLEIIAYETGRQVICEFQYCRRLFETQTVQRFIDYFKNIVSAVLADNRVRLSDIDILSPEEKETLLYNFNHTDTDYPQDETIHSWFRRQAQKTPGNIAVAGPSGQLDYRRLDNLSHALARELRSKGVGPHSIAAILCDPTPLMIIAILAVLKTGACYLPIDPANPMERVNYMLSDSGAKLLLTPAHLKDTLPFDGETVIIPEEQAVTDTSGREDINEEFPGAQDAQAPVYMIYTSGTTGKPKGVLLTHRNLVNYLTWFSTCARLTSEDHTILTSSFAFDLGYTSIYASLTNGSQLHVMPKDTYMLPGFLLNYIRDHRITFLKMTPSLFSVIVRDHEFSLEKFQGVRLVVLGGEAIIPADVETVYNLNPRTQIMNEYGPTEATIGCTALYIGREELDLYKARPTIGKPIFNTNAYILDPHLNILPVGIAGELCFSGAGIGLGYHKQPALTADKFPALEQIANLPAAHTLSSQHDRMYRTGDLGRWLPSGDIQFLGRMDFQIKIRGYRIEIKEIESKLEEHPAVKETVVLPLKNQSGNTALCAYIVPVAGCDVPEAEEFSRYLSAWLPEYMVPSYFVALESLPLTANGKLDHKALPKPEINAGSGYIAPQGAVQETLARMWSEMLEMDADKIGAADNFFQLGGNSLNAVVLISRIHKEFQVKLSLKTLFQSPDIFGLSKHIEAARRGGFAAIPAVEKKDYYPLSSAQKRLYIIHMMEEDSVLYNMPRLIRLREQPQPGQVEQVFDLLIRRHESLRTSFHMIDERPVQRIHDTVDFRLHYYESPVPSRDSLPVDHILNDFIKPFDLSRAPLIRAALVNTGEDNLLLIDMHHIISDGVSLHLLEHDFISLYQGKQLEPLRIQYKDFTLWQNSPQQLRELRKQEEYWLSRFSGEIPVLDLPTDYPRPAIQSNEGSVTSFELPPDQTAVLNHIARTGGATMFMVLSALLNVLLARLSNQHDIIIGTPVAGRRHDDLKTVVGMFVNTLALRNSPRENSSFNQFLQEVRENTLQALENQDYPFEDLVDKAAVQRDAGRNPLFDIMFALHNIRHSHNEPAAVLDNRDQIPGSAKFDLDITALESGNKILFEIQYCSRLFKAETIRRFSRYFKNIVAAVTQNSSVRLGDIDILPEDERQYLLQTLNDSAADYPADKAVHRLFEEQAARCPDNVALIGPARETMTYAQMNAAANRLARTLRHGGFNTGEIAAVTAAPSAQRIIALMAILKAGGAYLPIESGAPAERVRYILEDSAAAFVITDEQLPETLVNNRAVFPLTRGGTNAPAEPDQGNLDIDPGAQSPAYVIYTSGSTGKPKGVLVRRSNLRSYIFAFYREFDINADDTVIQQASFSFDAFVEEMYPVLLRGGKIAVPAKQEVLDIQLLVNFIVQNNVTMISASPLLLNELNQYPGSESLPVRIYISGGDVLNPGHIDKLVKTARVYNTYGPTESTVCVTYYNCAHLPKNAVSVPIGKPIANASVYVLDKRLNLTPVGVPGELCVAGPGVTAGYINRPELTAEKFNQDFQDYHDDQDKKIEADNRLYRTGDLVRWDSDGNLEFLGRIDNQVQIRGFRIELGEIEQALLRHEAVKDAVVLARTDNQNHRYLCAYIVGGTLPAGENETSFATALKQYLSAALPEYMIPAYIMQLETLPLTPTGKVDRKALPAPQLKAGKNYIAPRGAVEKKLTQLWARVLDTSAAVIGIRDNFFELGGHSLKATVLISRIRKEMGVTLPLVTLFKSPTIEQMARSIEACTPDVDDTPAQNRQDVVLLKKASRSDSVNAPNLFFIHEGYGEVAGYTEFCAALSDHYNCWGIRSRSLEGIAPVNLSIPETARDYAEKIKTLQEQGPYHIFGWCIGGTLAFEIVSILEQEGKEVGFFAIADTPPPQPSRGARTEDFSLRGELKAVKRAVKGIDESLYKDLKQSRDVAGLWNRIVDFLNSSPSEDPELTVHIRRMLGEEKSSAIPNFYNMSAFELLKTINTGRSLGQARDRYVPQRKIKTLVHFFSAEKGGVKNQHQWNRYTFTPLKSHVARGGHYSMFRGANAAALARQTMRILESLNARSRDVQTIAEQLPRKMKSHK